MNVSSRFNDFLCEITCFAAQGVNTEVLRYFVCFFMAVCTQNNFATQTPLGTRSYSRVPEVVLRTTAPQEGTETVSIEKNVVKYLLRTTAP